MHSISCHYLLKSVLGVDAVNLAADSVEAH